MNNQSEDRKGNVLIVDDTPENLQVLSATLSERGYKVRGAVKGVIGIRAARTAPPDLILLDIRMPDMSGYDVCKQLKADPITKEIPVIFISALDEVIDKVQAFQIGGVDYITKPFQVEEVLARVEHQLTIRRLQKQLLNRNQQLQQEILDRKRAEEAAEAASKAKSQFVANMSHELRTPLNAIIGFTQVMMRDPYLSSEQMENLRIISRSGEHLLDLINDVLDLSKIEAGVIGLYETSVDLYRTLDNLEEMFQIKADKKKLKLNIFVQPEVPQFIRTDEKKLRVCLINLLGNAMKFTAVGSITLRVKLGDSENLSSDSSPPPPLPPSPTPGLPQSPTFTNLVFEVEDTGLGIEPEEIDTLFDAFVQAKAGQKAAEGTGLGLTITRSFVQLMGGEISVSSILNQGTTFRFNISVTAGDSLEVISQPQQRVVALEANQTYRILVADDTRENRLLLMKLLQPVGFEVQEAENGEVAIALWETWQPDLIWMDTRMPIIDGIEATRIIRSKETSRLSPSPTPPLSRTAIVALTASAFEERRGEVLAAGCDDFVRKPFQEGTIFEKMAEFLGVRYVYEQLAQQPIDYVRKRFYSKERPDSIVAEKLREMPKTWVNRLYEAASEVNEQLIEQLIGEIPDNAATLAEALRDLLDDFRLDIIVKLTKLNQE